MFFIFFAKKDYNIVILKLSFYFLRRKNIILQIKNLTKQKINKDKLNNKKCILENISLTFPNKGMILITGKKGCKKTTLFNLLAGIQKPDKRDIFISNKSMKTFTDNDFAICKNDIIGIISKDKDWLLDGLTVKENIKLVLELQNKIFNTKEIKQILKKVNLSEKIELDSYISELNQVQKIKLTLTILIIKNPSIILAHEPILNVDTNTKLEIYNNLKQMSHNKLVIFFYKRPK
ncbi:MAG: ATP-binding cassette domain-containing protein [Candidatus Phytoplasma sp. TWB_XP]